MPPPSSTIATQTAQSVPIYERLRINLDYWLKTVPAPSVKIIKNGFYIQAPSIKGSPSPYFNSSPVVLGHIQKYIDLGAISPCERSEVWGTCKRKLRQKPHSSEYRLVSNLIPLNNHISTARHVKFPSILDVCPLIGEELWWGATIDISNAYLHVPMHKASIPLAGPPGS